MPFNKSEYDKEYAKAHITRKFIPFNDTVPEDVELIKHLSTVGNVTAYVKKLIRADMKTGFWVFTEEPDGYYHFDCSECERTLMPGEWDNRKNPFEEGFAYCPYCGAKMTNW